ncbi:class III signal peptide-containing protein, partial [Candidatus Micrarchaeota archaeon]|nr:class III signal peptide-containing protein [Candidatus Micrarchaeota archaeon]
MGMKGQISAEMLIILAIVIAVAVVLASQLLKSTKTMSASINESTSTIKSQTEAL